MDEGENSVKTYKIAVIPGDGAGPEVLTEGMKVLKRVAELDGSFQIEDIWFPWGCEYYLKTGRMMPEDGIEILETFDAIYLDFFGHEDWGKKVLGAIEDVLVDGVYTTPDIGGSASTSQAGDAIVEKLG
mgnify:CR=1 FL=1